MRKKILTSLIFLFGFSFCIGIATDKFGFTSAQKNKYRGNFNGIVLAYLQVSRDGNSQTADGNSQANSTSTGGNSLPVSLEEKEKEQVFLLSESELDENLQLENDLKDKGLLDDDKMAIAGKNFVQMSTYPVPTQDDIEANLDEIELGISPKVRTYSSAELQAKKAENLNSIYLYYNNLEKKIPDAKDGELQILRTNMANAIFLHDKMKDYCKGDPNFPEEVLGLNLYWLSRVRVSAIKEQISRGLVDANGNLIRQDVPPANPETGSE